MLTVGAGQISHPSSDAKAEKRAGLYRGAPIAAAAPLEFMAAQDLERGSEDDAGIAKVYAHNAGFKRPGED